MRSRPIETGERADENPQISAFAVPTGSSERKSSRKSQSCNGSDARRNNGNRRAHYGDNLRDQRPYGGSRPHAHAKIGRLGGRPLRFIFAAIDCSGSAPCRPGWRLPCGIDCSSPSWSRPAHSEPSRALHASSGWACWFALDRFRKNRTTALLRAIDISCGPPSCLIVESDRRPAVLRRELKI